jgi:hypothetical protein
MIHKKMIEVMKAVSHIGKNRKNQSQGFNFRGIDDVMNELHGIMSEVGVFIIPEAVGDTVVDERQSKSGGVTRFIVQRWKYTFYAEDGSNVTATAIGEAMDSGDKAMNKSMSIALKYCLLQTFLIPTEEDKDPDANSHDLKPKTLDHDQVMAIKTGIELGGVSLETVLEAYKVSKIEDIHAEKFQSIMKRLNATIDKKKEGEK